MTISAKLFSILTTGFKGDVLCFLHRDIKETGHAPGDHVVDRSNSL